MPSRVIRGEINESDSLSRVSMEADLTFRALLVAVDDFGRLDARPAKLKAALFPMRDAVTPADVVAWVEELAGIGDAPVVLYSVAGRPYLALVNWEEHRGKGRRAQDSRYPPPDAQDIPGDPRRSEDCHADPPEGRGTRDVGRGTRDEGTSGDLPDEPPRGGGSGDSASPPAPTHTDRARAVWPQLCAAAAEYGVTWAETPGKAQLATVTARIRDDGLDEAQLVHVIRGYIALRGTEVRGDFNPLQHLVPKTLYAPKNWPDYLAAGLNPPPRNGAKTGAAAQAAAGWEGWQHG